MVNGRSRPSSLSRWAIGVLLALITGAVPALAGVVWQKVREQDVKLAEDQKEIISLRVALAENRAEHQTILVLLRAIREDLKDYREEAQRR